MIHPLRGVLAYDPATGRILRALFGRAPQSGAHDPLTAHLTKLVGQGGPSQILDVAPNAMTRGVRYKVDPVNRTLVAVAHGEPGFAAASGATRPTRAP